MVEIEFSVRRLTMADIPGALALREAAGWNQTTEDWHRLLELEPGGCFGVECEGRLAATATVVCYGRKLAWIGMVLTHPDFRRRGLARRLMIRAIEYAGERGIEWMKLDATDSGAPLYAQLGFEPECAIERWQRDPDEPGASVSTEQYRPAPQLDLECFGADRSRLLESLARVEARSAAGGGFAMGRPGAITAFFGPCTTRSAAAARDLVAWFCTAHAGEIISWDLLPDNHLATALAGEFGFRCVRRLVRMSRPGTASAPAFRWDPSGIVAIAGFEFG